MNKSSFRQRLQLYLNKNSVFYKYLKKFTPLIFIPIILLSSVIYYLIYRQDLNKSTINTTNYTKNYVSCLNDNLDGITTLANTISIDMDVNWFITSKSISQNQHLRDSIDNINKFMLKQVNDVDYITSMHIYSPTSGYVLSTNNANFLSDFNKRHVVEKALESKQYFEFFLYDKSNTADIAICNYKNKKLNYIFIVTLDLQRFMNNKQFTDMKVTYSALIRDNKPIFSENLPANFTFSDKLNNNHGLFSIRDSITNTTFVSPLNSFDLWFVIGYDISDDLNIHIYALMSVLVIIISFLLSLVISAKLSFEYYKSINKIIVKYEGVFINSSQRDELETISYNIMHLLDQNKKITDELSEKLLLIQDTQLRLLQSQINPHFIFNTLNSISMYIAANCNNSEPATRLISLLSEIARKALDINKYYSTIAEEVDYSKKYIEIELLKCNNKFDVKWNIDNDLYECKTIKLILQPIIENAIRYGFRPNFPKFGGVLNISIYKKNGVIIFNLENSGCPIDDGILHDLNSSLQKPEITSRHIGLVNTVLRIKTNYGNSYGGRIYKHCGNTVVELTIPY